MKRLQIFKVGKHTASDGRVYTFTEAQLKAVAANYDPALHEAPLVVGHPKNDDPAYGWAKALTFADGALQVSPEQVDAGFAELVNAGRFKKISAAFYPPDAPENPKPGEYYLRHIGFLGAKPPAVKGLKNAEFGADDQLVVEFMDWSDKDNATLWRGLRDWIIGKFGKDEADKVIPDYLVTSLQESAVTADITESPAGISYSERNDVDPKEKEKLEAQKREQDAKAEEQRKKDIEFAEREKAVKTSEAAQRRVVIVAEVDVLVAAGKILPKDKIGLVAFIESLPANVIEFGEADKKVKTAPAAWLAAFLKNLPKAVEFKERGAGGENAIDESNPEHVAAELSRRAIEFVETERVAGRTVNAAQAVAHVSAKAGR